MKVKGRGTKAKVRSWFYNVLDDLSFVGHGILTEFHGGGVRAGTISDFEEKKKSRELAELAREDIRSHYSTPVSTPLDLGGRKLRSYERDINHINTLLFTYENKKISFDSFKETLTKIVGHRLDKKDKEKTLEHYVPSILLFTALVSSLFFPSISGASVYNVAETSSRNSLFIFGSVLAVAISFFCLRK